jgi:hypothetical protein
MRFDSTLRACFVLVALAWPTAAQSAAPQRAPGSGQPAAVPAAPAAVAADAPASASDEAVIAAQKPNYPLNSCLACGKIWGEHDTPLDIVRQGRLARVCNAECAKAFDAQAARWFKVLDDQVIAAQAPTYPLTHCPVTDDVLNKKPKFVVIGTRLVKVCCGDCRKELLGDPEAAAAAFAKVDAGLLAAQSISYPLKTCVVDDKPLGDAPVQMLYGVTLVRFCSDACEAQFKADPHAFRTKIEALRHVAPPSGEAQPGQ